MASRVLGGRYTVQDKVGTGGMAIVYRGLDEVLGRTVAIKTMLPQYASEESFAMRFKQEAQAAAALQSPYIVSVYDWGKDDDTYYIVMEYLRGTDLKSGIRRHGALDPRKVAQIGSQIAQALSVAHKHDIIHRDIKPQNIMVQPDGNVKVMDFGIARAKNSHLTTDNSVLGTAHYVSPEQTQGHDLGPTTDIYSLGIVMYEAATGKVPFDGDDAITVALKQVNEQPLPPSQVNPNVDPALEGIILRCMQKNPADRFQTADELYRVLRDYLAGQYQAVNAATAVVPTQIVSRVDTHTTTPVISTVDSRTSTGRTSGGRKKPISATERAALEEKRAEKKRRRRLVFGAIFGTIIVLGIAYAAITFFNLSNQTREVPNLLNLTEEQAVTAIVETDFFERGEITREYSDTVAEGVVVDQDPDPQRKLERGTSIDLVVSKGPEPAKSVTVPDLRNMTPSEAEAKLREFGLIGKVGDSVYDNEIVANNVASQSPTSGATAKEGDTVTYYLSKGKEVIEIPSVQGKDRYTAEAELTAAGFVVDFGYDSSDTYDEGYVISQSHTGTAEKGTTITIYISTGSQQIEIPYVVSKDVYSATYEIQAAGFAVYTSYEYSSEVDSGYVISQSETGTAVAGTTITLVVSSGPDPATTDDTTDNGEGTEETGGTTATDTEA